MGEREEKVRNGKGSVQTQDWAHIYKNIKKAQSMSLNANRLRTIFSSYADTLIKKQEEGNNVSAYMKRIIARSDSRYLFSLLSFTFHGPNSYLLIIILSFIRNWAHKKCIKIK